MSSLPNSAGPAGNQKRTDYDFGLKIYNSSEAFNKAYIIKQ